MAKRLTLGLFQKDVAKLLGTDTATIMNWEKGHHPPTIQFYPAIQRFLGYIPETPGPSIGERLRHKRRWLGLSIDALAAKLKVDPTALGNWERGELILYHQHRKMIVEFLNEPVDDVRSAMAVQWGKKHRLNGKRRKPSPYPSTKRL